MGKETVALIKCDTYETNEVDKAVTEMLEMLDGLDKLIKPGMKVFLKINLLMRKLPEEQVTTNPSVVAAVARYIKKLGADVIVGDSPGGPFTEWMLKSVYERCGITKMAAEENLELNYDISMIDVFYNDAVILKKFTAVKAIYDADAVISMGKLKTHGMTAYTGAVKNMFGCIPGMIKAQYHYRMPQLKDFSNMLVDVEEYFKPVISIVDAVYAMEGDGPSAGTPRKVGAIIAGFNPHAVDTVAISLTNIDPLTICTVKRAEERGLFSGKLSDVDLKGAKVEDLIVKDFKQAKVHSTALLKGHVPKILEPLAHSLEKLMTTKPVIDENKCKGCKDCYNTCPPHTIQMVNGKAVINYDNCIKCFCCQELCPYKAIEIKKSWLLRMISR